RNACAIMYTASHNPPDYLGIKFIPDYAGPATSDITNEIVSNIDKDFNTQRDSITYNLVDFRESYYKHIKNIVDFEKIKKLSTNIVFDGLYSASIGYFDDLLAMNNIQYQSLHLKHDRNFGGLMPDPKPKYLKELITAVKNNENAIGLANDGDADRFGVIDESGNYVAPDMIIAILLRYLLKKGYTGSIVKTVGSSILIDRVTEELGINTIETAVGFKYIGEAMRGNDVIIGGEESGGLSIKGHIPEKDGIIANLLLLEAIADSGKKLTEIQEDVYNLIGTKFYTDRIDVKTDDREKIDNYMNYFKEIDMISVYQVSKRTFIDGVKLNLGSKSKILVRPSGTEPLLRIYFESDSLESIEKLDAAIRKLIKEI
ncbi:phosphoglucomutase/phosphomannomutase family protein, partial [bacterium]|nr:phosphoglucomutase/phosphomannomutase family protein [bacterium]